MPRRPGAPWKPWPAVEARRSLTTPDGTALVGVGRRDEDKAVDPVALASLVLSLPSAALAVADLADRIRKRRRAAELIDHAQHLAVQQVNVSLIVQGRPVELRTLTPDQLIDQFADEGTSELNQPGRTEKWTANVCC
jgi:hypothetical protein